MALTVRQADKDRVAEMPGVRGAFPDYRVHILQPPNVEQIGVPAVWGMTDDLGRPVRGAGMRVAVIDTGIDYAHPDLGGCFGDGCKVIGGYDLVNDDLDPFDDHGHGSHVAGIIAADGALLGVAPETQLLAYKAMDASGEGEDFRFGQYITATWTIDGLYAADPALQRIVYTAGHPLHLHG